MTLLPGPIFEILRAKITRHHIESYFFVLHFRFGLFPCKTFPRREWILSLFGQTNIVILNQLKSYVKSHWLVVICSFFLKQTKHFSYYPFKSLFRIIRIWELRKPHCNFIFFQDLQHFWQYFRWFHEWKDQLFLLRVAQTIQFQQTLQMQLLRQFLLKHNLSVPLISHHLINQHMITLLPLIAPLSRIHLILYFISSQYYNSIYVTHIKSRDPFEKNKGNGYYWYIWYDK